MNEEHGQLFIQVGRDRGLSDEPRELVQDACDALADCYKKPESSIAWGQLEMAMTRAAKGLGAPGPNLGMGVKPSECIGQLKEALKQRRRVNKKTQREATGGMQCHLWDDGGEK
ncbi:hypothetical protein LCGC14_2031680 [marine sediment metagenome]|uniref:Uncharacterized protein n=1 Tax=marine sediment metagenome TaxID=412755 RepID=A0A0F9H810_9ZZZZ